MFHPSRISDSNIARHQGEERGTKIGIIIALTLLFLWFFDMSPFGSVSTLILMGLSVIFMRYYGGEMEVKRYKFYADERDYISKSGIQVENIIDYVAKMHGH